MQEVRLDLLMSKPVRDKGGKKVGHIQEIHLRKAGDEWVVHEYIIGASGLFERLSIANLMASLLRRLGADSHTLRARKIPWNALDISDPDNLRLTKPFDECCPEFDEPPPPRNWFKQGGVQLKKSA